MSAPWQQFQPFWIDRFLGSAAVQAMDPACKWGYWMLCCRQWQSDDCTVSSDPFSLAQDSGLGKKGWQKYGAQILRNFAEVENAKLRNNVTYEEWMKAKRVHEARIAGGKHKLTPKTPIAQPSSAIGEHKLTPSSTDTRTDTGTDTGTGQEKQKPSRVKAASDGMKHSKDPRHVAFKEAIGEYWKSKNPGIDMPWGGHEGKELGMWLREAPHITVEQFKGFLRGRFKSDVNHGERPSQWIRWITSYGQPVDRFGKPQGDGVNGQSGSGVSATKHRVDRNLAAIDKALERRGLSAVEHDRQADGAKLSSTGLERVSGGLSVGLRAVVPEIQHDAGNAGAGRAENPTGPEILPPAA